MVVTTKFSKKTDLKGSYLGGVAPICVFIVNLAGGIGDNLAALLPGPDAGEPVLKGFQYVYDKNASTEPIETYEIYQCVNNASSQFDTKSFAYEGRCKSKSDKQGCYYYDYRNLDLPDLYGFDQRGVESYQVSFPNLKHKWAALAVEGPGSRQFCWSGGAHVGRNPLAMTWSGGSGSSGTKNRKNNFLLSQGGQIIVEGARVHNIHDAFLADTPESGFDIRRSWITWNRDDFFEGYLHNLSITDTLIDGTYTFLSDPDGECNSSKQASDRKIVIRDSLIRLQRQPGPYARRTEKWHWSILGGHHRLWKLDSCDWPDWPKFELTNNIFYIEGPSSNRSYLDRGRCDSALPGDCGDESLSNIVECSNNLFIYEDFDQWTLNDVLPGPTPLKGHNFYNPGNPNYLPNARDCYQRITDDPNDPGFQDVGQVWQKLKAAWISKNSDVTKPDTTVMQVPGVDYSVLTAGTKINLINAQSGLCIHVSKLGAVTASSCADSINQVLTVETFNDGKLAGAILFKDYLGRYLRTQSPEQLEAKGDDSNFSTEVFTRVSLDGSPGFHERWYMLPKANEPLGVADTFVIESDALRRSYLRGLPAGIGMQHFYSNRELTPSPYSFDGVRADSAMHWSIEIK